MIKYFPITVKVEEEFETEISVNELLDQLSPSEKQSLLDELNPKGIIPIIPVRLTKIDNQADMIKLEYLASIFDKFSELELRDKLKLVK